MPNPFDGETIADTETAVSIEDLVGEGKKYKDPNELAKAYKHADSYLEQLKLENAAKDAEAKVLKDLLEARQKTSSEPATQTPPVAQETPREQAPDPKAKEDINELIRKEMANASEEKRKSDNINAAAEALSRHYGSPAKAQEAIRNRASELGVAFEWLRDVAATSPSALFSSMGINPGQQRSSNTPGYTAEVSIDRTSTGVKGYKFYDDIRKANKKLYDSPEMRKQMLDSARELGDKFFAS